MTGVYAEILAAIERENFTKSIEEWQQTFSLSLAYEKSMT